MTGTLYGVGVGPGDPDLITIKAAGILRSVSVIAYIHAEGRDSMARAIAAAHIGKDKTEIAIPIPMEQTPDAAQRAYDAHMPRITQHLDADRHVAVLCEGDPFFYGSFIYIHDRLADRYAVRVIPGVTSVSAAAASAGVMLATRNQTLAVIPATLPEDQLGIWLAGTEQAAIIKLGRNKDKVRRVLRSLGLEGRAIYMERVGLEGERVVPFSEAEEGDSDYFSLVLVGRKDVRR